VTRSGPESGRGNREERVTALLAVAAAPRERVLDEHMYAVDRGQHRNPATFRLQLFTAPGTRPVAIVIQHLREDGALIHERERYAETVWRQHCPDEAEPPIWIDRLLFPWRDDEWLTVASFPVTGPYQLGEPRGRTRITVPEITRLLGIPPDISRGAGFRPRPPAPEPLPRYSTEWVLRIPRPVPFRNRRCMPPRRPWWRDALRQLAPQHTGRDCCWMHQGDWHQVSRTAITLVRQAQCDGIVGEDICGHVLSQARAAGVTGWQLDALECLVNCYDGIQLDTGDDGRRFFINGQHKTRAMLDQGVRRTIIVQWQSPAQPRGPVPT
jgi:hypothetical protein